MEGGDQLQAGFSLASLIHEPSRRRAGKGLRLGLYSLLARALGSFAPPENFALPWGCHLYSCLSAVKFAALMYTQAFHLAQASQLRQQPVYGRIWNVHGERSQKRVERSSQMLGANNFPSLGVSALLSESVPWKVVFRLAFRELSGIWLFQTTTGPKLPPFIKCSGSALPSGQHLSIERLTVLGSLENAKIQEARLSSWKSLD